MSVIIEKTKPYGNENVEIMQAVPEQKILEQIRAEIITQFEGCYLEEDMTDERKAEHKAQKEQEKMIKDAVEKDLPKQIEKEFQKFFSKH